ncbi:hypothetical protein BG011_000577 [Mortierella polycephala]|uniref:Saccharopine dehydrogenase NADP binding domain-containing protein n=1 Tax=Mortierella polycephala TaxID=41804 RepID=A0A9P6U5V6_9FUNG|nr:hypothetical protein BG011_000577 [Mortierella polycephala]
MNKREFDLVLYGASGFTGLRTCQYIARTYKQGVRWAIAGRSIPKLEQVREKLVAIDPSLSNLELIKADASNTESLEAMTARTKVVISTVGPFLQYGEPLVAACIKTGTHYIDSTGETPFVYNIIRKYHDEARNKNIILVPQCGFDSVPSELGTKLVVDFLRKEYNLPTKSAKLTVTKLRGAASGGTFASLMGILDAKEGGISAMVDQNQLVPEDVASKVAPAKISMPTFYYDYDFKQWQMYFIMSSSNEKMVKRSHGLAIESDGSDLSAGPSDESIAKGHFTIKVVGESSLPENVPGDSTQDAGPVKAVAVIQGTEPGYSETCRYLVEGAMCLVQDEDRVRSENKITGGVLTPAFAFGQILVDRLRSQNVQLTVSKL